ncbi:MAG TPA: Rieske 2Fe-2S domain-containing protein [Gaiellaceae bacterium]|nr:Rieske 2Fe-2S domain-containing protein [Gaiellaceae bacterium]
MEPHRGDENRHHPTPSIWPVGFAVGIASVLAGLVVSWPAVVAGAVIAVVFGFLWARDAMATPAPVGREELGGVPAGAVEPEVVEDEDVVDRYPRNKFLELTTLGLGGVITGIVSVPIVGFAVLPAFTDQEHKTVDLGPIDNFPENEWREATFLLDPARGEVSRRTAFVRYNGDFEGQPSYTIISNRCVHLGCPVQASGPRNENERKTVKTEQAELTVTPVRPANFSCPCHGGAYDTEGNRIAGPPVRAMDRYKFGIVDGHLHLLEPYSVGKVEGEGASAKLEAYGLQGPGEHVDGLEAWLYPLQPQDLR